MDIDKFQKQGWSRNRGSYLQIHTAYQSLDDDLHKEPLIFNDAVFAARFLPWLYKNDQDLLGVLMPN